MTRSRPAASRTAAWWVCLWVSVPPMTTVLKSGMLSLLPLSALAVGAPAGRADRSVTGFCRSSYQVTAVQWAPDESSPDRSTVDRRHHGQALPGSDRQCSTTRYSTDLPVPRRPSGTW